MTGLLLRCEQCEELFQIAVFYVEVCKDGMLCTCTRHPQCNFKFEFEITDELKDMIDDQIGDATLH
jgi:hypothetical protein